MTLADVLSTFERRRDEAARMHATAPVADVLATVLKDLRPLVEAKGSAATDLPGATWRERLWICPGDTRLGVREVAEAVGRPRSFVYRSVSATRGPRRLPHSRLGGELVFRAMDVRDWITRADEGHLRLTP